MHVNKTLDLSLDSLPLDVFELAESGLEVESLTAGHGMPENAASRVGGYSGGGSCGCAGNWIEEEDED